MKQFYFLLLLLCCASAVRAQFSPGGDGTPGTPGTPSVAPSRWTPHVDSLFQHLDRAPVSTGLLVNYGVALKDYNRFQGSTLDTTNRLRGLPEWRLLYGALQSSRYNNNATLPLLSAANPRLTQAIARQQAGQALDLAVLLARYERFRDDAGTAGLLTVSNNQLYDNPNRTRSPYEQRTLLAVCPVVGQVITRTPQLRFATALRFTNAAPSLSLLELDADDGQGYRPASWNQALTASYASNGTYTLRFRFTCPDGTVLLAHAQLSVAAPDAARYQPDNASGTTAVTYPSTALFTDTRAYSNGGYLPSTRAATGKVTIAYAQGNTTNTIRRPLIVVEGYDPSYAVNKGGVQRIPDYDYNQFVTSNLLGGINVNYDNIDFNRQLSEVGQYDLIFLNFTNGTDYIQRNAFLLERLIQWVNEHKQPMPGQAVAEKNIVLGMSTGGLIARYALRDMEVRHDDPAIQGPDHDTRLYLSHEAPHQGANVPLGFQYLVKGVAGITIAGVLTAADLSPELTQYARLLDEPATQQLLIYQTDQAGTSLHASWLSEYNGLGYPQRCRSVATSGGSECGRGQDFAPYTTLVNIQGNGLLDAQYNFFANLGLFVTGNLVGLALVPVAGPFGYLAGLGIGFVLSLGNYEGHAEFLVNALPDHRKVRIYHGRFTVCKEILLGLYTTCLADYDQDEDSDAAMLPYDSAPGGIYNIVQFAGSNITKALTNAVPFPLSQVYLYPTFCFVPTTSALDIGGGQTALDTPDLTASYQNTAPPAAPRNSPFANFITAGRENLTHIRWTGLNSK